MPRSNPVSVKDFSYLIIGGVPKAGTTSLFRYLSEHPEICGSNTKETFFFIPLEIQRGHRPKYSFEDGLETYGHFFTHCRGERIRLEATPAYIYSEQAAARIRSSLPQVELIFILRDPIDRLTSWFRFATQNDWLPATVTFQQFVESQLQTLETLPSGPSRSKNQVRRGRYCIFLDRYYHWFAKDQIRLVQYERMRSNPRRVLRDICESIGIDPDFYQNYDFKIYNPTPSLRYPKVHGKYVSLSGHLRQTYFNHPRVSKLLNSLNHLLRPIYFRLNTRARQPLVISQDLRQRLRSYYHEELALFETQFEREA